MKPLMRLSSTLLLLLFLATAAWSNDDPAIIQKYSPPRVDVYNIARTNRVTHRANVWLNVTNFGCYGNWGAGDSWAMEDPEHLGTWAPQCEFPGGSGIQYLFMGAPWIGALVQEGGSTFARVSVGSEGWTGPGLNEFELEPGEAGGYPVEEHGILERSCIPSAVNYLGQSIYSPEAVAHQEYIAVYTDTLTELFWVGTDIVDGLHYPLGVRVTQKAMVWDALGFEDFIILEFTLENIGSHDLQNLYLGFLVDGDVGWIGEGIYHEDDVAGFLQNYAGQTWNVPYIADNDGRPEAITSGNDFTCPGVSGIYGLQAAADTAYTSFNWWISNGNPDLDFGPSWLDDGSQGNWTAIYGTPNGDERKYFLMSNKEVDYDQWYVADHEWVENHPQVFTDPFTGITTTNYWKIEDLTYAPDLANGYDARYLLSTGPLGENIAAPGEEPETYLYPGESFQISFAYVCGDGFHDPENPQGDVSGNNPIDPSKYVYDDLVYNCSRAQYLFDQGYPLLPYSPDNFRVLASPDTAIWLAWSEYLTMPGTAVNIFRKPEGGEYGDPINAQPIEDTVFVDTDVSLGDVLTYKAQAVKSDTILSCFTGEIAIIVGAPFAPTGLSADSSDNGVIYLSWNPNVEPDLDHYAVYRSDSTGALQPLDTVPHIETTFEDHTVTNGIEYTYALTAVDGDSLESFFSDSVTAIAMEFSQHLLVIRECGYGPLFEWPPDSLTAFYEQLFADIGEEPDFINLQMPTATFPSLPELSPYQILWLINDNHALLSWSYIDQRDQVLTDYVANGGKVVISGRRMFSGGFGFPDGWSSTPDNWLSMDLLRDYFKIDSICATRIEQLIIQGLLPEFLAATSTQSGYPVLEVDTGKVNLIQYLPEEWIYLPEVDVMVPTEEGEIFYTFDSASDSSVLEGYAVGIRYLQPYTANYLLTFPLYAMQPYESVMELAEKILDDIDTGIEEEGVQTGALPMSLSLKQNYPNPFNAQTILEFEVPQRSEINLDVFNIRGSCVARLAEGTYNAGRYRIALDGVKLASGVYFARLSAGSAQVTKKLVLLK